MSLLFMINAQLSAKINILIPNLFIAFPVNLALTFCLFVFFWAISPQIFYLYYQFLFEGLPWQLVVKDWFPAGKTLSLLLPGTIHNTSSLAAGVTLIMLLIQAALGYYMRKQSRN